MLEYIVIGGGFAFAAAAQPGPLQAFLISRVAADGWRRTLPAAFAPLVSDGPIAVVVLTLLHQVARGFESCLKGVGGIFHLEVDGSDVTGPLQVPDTGGWYSWTMVEKTDVLLPAGEHVLRVAMAAHPPGGGMAAAAAGDGVGPQPAPPSGVR